MAVNTESQTFEMRSGVTMEVTSAGKTISDFKMWLVAPPLPGQEPKSIQLTAPAAIGAQFLADPNLEKNLKAWALSKKIPEAEITRLVGSFKQAAAAAQLEQNR